MGELRGFVTRSIGQMDEALFGITSGTDSISRNQFMSTRPDGTQIGSFSSVRLAQQALENSVGGGFLKWTRRDLANNIEHYEGAEIQFFPGDLNPTLSPQTVSLSNAAVNGLLFGGIWLRADQGVRKQPSGETLDFAPRWVSFDGSRGANTALSFAGVGRPRFLPVGLGGRPALRFSNSVSQELVIPNLTGSIAAPFVALAVATFRAGAPAREQTIVQSDGGFVMGTTIGARWFVDSSAGRITGAAAAEGEPAIISAIVLSGGVEGFLNGVSIGSNGGSAVAGDWSIGDLLRGWHQDISEVIVVPNNVGPVVHDKLVRYLQRRYLLTS